MLPQTSPKQNYTIINTSVNIRGKISYSCSVVAENTPPNATTTDANLPNAMAEEVATAGEVAVDMVVEVMVEIEVVAAVMGEGVVAMVEVEEEEETF